MIIEKYIEYGNKKLTSGIESDIYYNFRKLTKEDKEEIVIWLKEQSEYYTIVAMFGISYEIAKLTKNIVICYNPHTNNIENKHALKYYKYVIFDDVITTFGTIRKCILKIGKLPEKIICIKNRLEIIEFVEVLKE